MLKHTRSRSRSRSKKPRKTTGLASPLRSAGRFGKNPGAKAHQINGGGNALLREDYVEACFAASLRFKTADSATCEAYDASAQPAMIIKYGPPASGKSVVAKLLRCDTSPTFYDIQVDDFVVLAARFFVAPAEVGVYDGTSVLTEPQYWFFRRNFGDAAFTHVLQRALMSGKTVFVETTGKNIGPMEERILQARRAGYKIVCVFLLVQLTSLVERCRGRVQASNCDEEHLGEAERLAAANFLLLVKNLDSLRILDNNGKETKLVYRQDRRNGEVHATCFPVKAAFEDVQLRPVVDFLLQQCGSTTDSLR